MVFPVIMYGCENWTIKKAEKLILWPEVLEKTLASPLDCKEIQPVHPIGDQSWVFIGRTDVEAETPILWPSDAKRWLIWKDPDVGKDWRLEEMGMIEEGMIGWRPWLNGCVWVSSGPWGYKESDTTEWLNWTELHNLDGICIHIISFVFVIFYPVIFIISLLQIKDFPLSEGWMSCLKASCCWRPEDHDLVVFHWWLPINNSVALFVS